jgi:hypothetical protein
MRHLRLNAQLDLDFDQALVEFVDGAGEVDQSLLDGLNTAAQIW